MNKTNRREMFRTLIRMAALGGLGLASAWLLGRNPTTCRSTQHCANCKYQPNCVRSPNNI